MAPSKVNLRALLSRLRTTFSHISRSTWTGALSAGQSTSRAGRPAPRRAEHAGQLGGEGARSTGS